QLDHNEIFWTGGSYYGGVPYTGFASFTMALGGQYFGLSYEKLYHPVGRYPEIVKIPKPIGNAGPPPPNSLFYTENLIIPSNDYKWFGGAGMGGLDPSWQEFLGDKYRQYINLPFQTNSVLLTYATPLTADKSFNFGVNVKYMFTDADAKKVITDEFDAWAWGLDVGFLYKLRLIEFLKDLNISIMLRDVSGQMKRYKTGIEKNLYFTSTIGLSMRTTQLIEKEVTSFSVDFNSVNDPGVLEQEKYRFNFGAEQWFIDGHFAVRGGLVDVMYPGTWRMSLGLSVKYIFGIDYAYVCGIPLGQEAENEGDSHWISLHWEWGKVARKLPTPDVFAAVEPISFAPKNGETVIFKLNATSKAGIDRWALNILDKNNNLVKSYVDINTPPSQIVWNGTDNKYQPLSDGEYTFIFEATDKLGSTASTPVQTVKLFTPVLEAVNKEALNKLKALLKQIGDRDLAEDNAQIANAKAGVEEWKAIKGKPTPVPPPPAGTIPEPLPLTAFPGFENYQGATPSAAAGNVNVAGFPNVESSAIRSAYITTDADGNKQFMMEYATANTLPQYVMK
ncbi:MAG TPA: FlgD immunoglobulin-like domain containing protein, partial [Candidatus Goldiibacteriota bacterium]|nr:FlgD immunoglobulin-like domain containing protein [Candidatus Goldiibacteriota bacterium]